MSVAFESNLSSNMWKDRSVFVTGATGLLGGWLVPALVKRGASVVVLIRDSLPKSLLVNEGWLKELTAVHGSMTDENLIRRTLAEYSVQTIFHIGAQTLVGVAKNDPIGTLETNVRGTWTVLEAARQSKVEQVLVASSDKAYGENVGLPYREEYSLHGSYPYEVSKSCTDLISQMYAKTYGMKVGVVRCGNLFGGGDLNFSRLIPGAVRATLRGENFRIRSDGKFVRDFLYVEDAAEAYILLAEHLAANPALAGEAFNFGLGLRPTMLDIVDRILEIMDRRDLAPIIENIANNEIREQYMASDKAHKLLGWAPSCGMDEGLKRTIAWYRGHFAQSLEPAAVANGIR